MQQNNQRDNHLIPSQEYNTNCLMNKTDARIIKNFKSLVAKRAKVHDVIVFGSRARGNATEESDLDVLVVVESLDGQIERYISDCAWDAGFPDDIVIVPIVISAQALKDSPIRSSAFIKTIYREGLRI